MVKKAPVKKGRPPVAVKKERFQLMLDPRYLDHFKKVAKRSGIEVQDLGRAALMYLVTDPNNTVPIGDIEMLKRKLEKALK